MRRNAYENKSSRPTRDKNTATFCQWFLREEGLVARGTHYSEDAQQDRGDILPFSALF